MHHGYRDANIEHILRQLITLPDAAKICQAIEVGQLLPESDSKHLDETKFMWLFRHKKCQQNVETLGEILKEEYLPE
jgi:hypothetical protein